MKYLGVKIYENLNWKDHIHNIATKLNRANAMHSYLKSGIMLILIPGNQFTWQSVILI